jgi:thymidylate kinase
MTVIIFEGVNGVGKTTIAREVGKRLGIPVYRAFRSDGDNHYVNRGESTLYKLNEWKVPFNTFVDDLYMADFLRATNADLILDRSLPSAIAYAKIYQQQRIPDQTDLVRFWLSLIREINPLFVWLTADYEVACNRTDNCTFPTRDKYEDLGKMFDGLFYRYPYNRMIINTDYYNVAAAANAVCRHLGT